MVSRVLYRPFDTEDFDAIALILQQLWHNNSDNDEYNRLEAACDLAYCLSSSTFSQVAVIDGEARGISLARAGQSSGATVKEHWMDTERALLSQMRELEPDACAEYLSFVRATIRTNNRLLESSPLPHDNEVTLLAVDRDVHGLGVGSVLLDAARKLPLRTRPNGLNLAVRDVPLVPALRDTPWQQPHLVIGDVLK